MTGPRTARPLHLAVSLEGTGRHPAAWRRPDSRAEELFTAPYWVDLARSADTAGVDLLLLPDAFSAHDGGPDIVRGRLDAAALAARLALETTTIGLVPVLTTTHTEPFHVAKAVQSLDHTSHGRAGWEVAVSTTQAETDLVGRSPVRSATSLWAEAGEAVEAATLLWDSWDDDAEIRDVATGRFVDRERLHYTDFVGEHFSVKGPSITPRSPQGHPLVVVRADDGPSLAVAAAHADIVRVSAPHIEAAGSVREQVRSAVRAAGRDTDEVSVLLDLEVLTAPTPAQARSEVAQLEAWAHHEPSTLSYTGTPEGLAELLHDLQVVGAADGITLVPLTLPSGLTQVYEQVVPLLRSRGVVTEAPAPGATLRERFGLARPTNLFARQEVTA